jgi:hypothetical protein
MNGVSPAHSARLEKSKGQDWQAAWLQPQRPEPERAAALLCSQWSLQNCLPGCVSQLHPA